MADLPPTIEVTSSVWREACPLTIVVQHITCIGQDGIGEGRGAFIGTIGGQHFRVRETYEEVQEKVRKA